MAKSSHQTPSTARRMSYRTEPESRELLDHIARELAAEYVRLVRDRSGSDRRRAGKTPKPPDKK